MLMSRNDVPRRRLGRRRRRRRSRSRRHRAARAYSKKPPPGRDATATAASSPTHSLAYAKQAAKAAARRNFGRPAVRRRSGARRGAFLINICTGLVSRYLFRFINHASTGTRAYIIVGGGVLIGRPPELFARSLTPLLHTFWPTANTGYYTLITIHYFHNIIWTCVLNPRFIKLYFCTRPCIVAV